jgi:hypothetical protein
MQVSNLKMVMSAVAYRVESVVFAADNSCYVNFQLGVVGGTTENRTFDIISTQSHNLTPEEVAGLKVELIDEEPLRVVIERVVEDALRAKGVLKL